MTGRDRGDEARERASQAGRRVGELTERLDQLRSGAATTAEGLQGAAASADRAAEHAQAGYEHAARAHERAADVHDRAAEGLDAQAANDGDASGDLNRRAQGHRQAARSDRNGAANDRGTAGGTSSERGYGSDHATAFSFGLHHVQLAIPAGSEDECRRFYVDVLGLAEVRKPPVLAARGGLWVRGDGIEVHLGVEDDFRPARRAHPGIRVRGLDDLARHLTEHGVPLRLDDDFPGHRRFYADDPVGNRLEFIEREGTHHISW